MCTETPDTSDKHIYNIQDRQLCGSSSGSDGGGSTGGGSGGGSTGGGSGGSTGGDSGGDSGGGAASAAVLTVARPRVAARGRLGGLDGRRLKNGRRLTGRRLGRRLGCRLGRRLRRRPLDGRRFWCRPLELPFAPERAGLAVSACMGGTRQRQCVRALLAAPDEEDGLRIRGGRCHTQRLLPPTGPPRHEARSTAARSRSQHRFLYM